MKTFTLSIVFVLSFVITGCSFNFDALSNLEKIEGKGKIITEQLILEHFEDLQLKRGWDVILKPASSNYMVVEANENLLEVLDYDNKEGTLIIGALKQISKAEAKIITLYFSDTLESLKVSSGTTVSSPDQLHFDDFVLDLSSGAKVSLDAKLESLELETSSGATTNLKLNLKDLNIDSSSGSSASLEVHAVSTQVESSSGSSVNLKGSTNSLEVKTSSGSSLDAKRFQASYVYTKASSGSSISVFPLKDLKAETSSGGEVSYYNKPTGELDINKSKSGGGIQLK